MPYLWLIIAIVALATNVQASFPEAAIKDHAEAFATTAAPATENYNFKVGPVTTDLSSRFQAEYNDNLSQTSTNKVDDVIARANLISKSRWPVTQLNTLTLDLDLGYRYYFNNSDLNSNNNFLDVNPGSELAFKWYISNFTFKLSDQVRYTVDSANIRVFNSQSNTVDNNLVEFGRLENRAGLDNTWNVNEKTKVFFGYTRDDVRADKSDFNSIDRVKHSFYVTPLHMLTDNFSVGLLTGYSMNRYVKHISNDSDSFVVGPSANWQITQNTSVGADVYWNNSHFKSNGTIVDSSKTSNLNADVKLNQQVNNLFSHSLVIARSTDVGTVSNSTTANSIFYDPSYMIRENIALKGRLGYEEGKDSASVNAEKYTRRTAGLGFGYNVNSKTAVDLFYTYTNQGSNIDTRNFDQNRVILTVNYDF